jgi:hypothetical protein
MNQQQLTAIFEKLGARDAEDWAYSQVEEGVPQLARFLFLRQAWRAVVADDDPSWITGAISRAEAHPTEPYAGVGLALAKLVARGATHQELTDLVRGMQAQLLFAVCYLLEDPGELEPEVRDVSWALVQCDKDGNLGDRISALHESVLETDPTGREMRPRPARDPQR